MAAFLVRRLLLGLLVLAAISAASFCIFQLQVDSQHSPLPAYWAWVKGLWGGPSLHALTQPIYTRNFVQTPLTMLNALGHTAVLVVLALALVAVFAVVIAVAAASRQGDVLDVLLRALSYLAWATPAFLLGLLVQLAVNTLGGARGIGPFPLAGWPGSCPAGIGLNSGYLTPCPAAGTGIDYVGNVLRYTTLPALTLAAGFVGLHARYLRSALLDTLGAPFVTTARAKGLPERSVLVRHVLRASLVTFVGALLSDFGTVLGAAMAVDFVFQFNGLGTVFISEFPIVGFRTVDPIPMTALLVLTGMIVVAASLIAELSVSWLDPRAGADR